MSLQPFRLSPIESAVSYGIGAVEGAPPLPEVAYDLDPLVALEQATLPALLRPPCLVAFSGGRDSSLVLAVATRAARAHGLPLPIPVTQTFRGYPETDESEWQELVLRHLNLTEHRIQRFVDELNRLGPYAREAMRQHGLIAPSSASHMSPIYAEARGGSVMTGVEGDGLFGGGRYRKARSVLARRQRLTPRGTLSLLRAASPRPVRHWVALRRNPPPVSWLRDEPRAELRRLEAAEAASEPFRFDEYVGWFARRRYVAVVRQAAVALAGSHDAQAVFPLLDPTFLAAVAQRGGALGWSSRAHALASLFEGLLPDAVYERTSKANFTRAFWSGEVRTFVAAWDGSGLPNELVDPDVLREVWQREKPDAGSGLLLQAAWAASSGADELPEPFNCGFE